MRLDRGNKLWVGHRIILPEHEALIHEQERKENVYHPPELDEDQLQEMEYVMQRALYEDMAVPTHRSISTWSTRIFVLTASSLIGRSVSRYSTIQRWASKIHNAVSNPSTILRRRDHAVFPKV